MSDLWTDESTYDRIGSPEFEKGEDVRVKETGEESVVVEVHVGKGFYKFKLREDDISDSWPWFYENDLEAA